MVKIKAFFSLISQKAELVPPSAWLLILIFLPLNFLYLKESFGQKEDGADVEMAFSSPATTVSSKNSLSEIMEFTIFSKNKKDGPCQLASWLNGERLSQKEIKLKAEKKSFSLEKDLEEGLLEKKGGKIEIHLQCQNLEESINKNLVL